MEPGKFEEAVALHRAGRLPEAAAAYRDVARGVLTVNLAQNLGACLQAQGRLAEAERWLRLALQNRPDDPALELSLAETLLAQGRYAEGWPLFEARAKVFPGATTRLAGTSPEWRGEPLAGRTIVVVQEQGLGDQIMFARFAPLLKARGAGRVVVCCQAPLARLFTSLAGLDEVIGIGGGEAVTLTRPFTWVRCMSLAERFGATVETVPAAPYLSAPARPAAGRIGVVVSGNRQNPAAPHRDLSPDAAATMLALPGALDLDPRATGARDLQDTAEIVAGLELVVSVDTAPAHLAGALGKPVWVLLPHYWTDWRWMRERSDSPWYPSARLFRQPAPGAWGDVVEAVRQALG